MTSLPVDLDLESIEFEGEWCTREDLARRIHSMLDAGNYNIGPVTAALEQLSAEITGLRTLAFRAPAEMAEALSAAAARQSKTVAALIREAIRYHLDAPESERPPEHEHEHEHVHEHEGDAEPLRPTRKRADIDVPSVHLAGPTALPIKPELRQPLNFVGELSQSPLPVVVVEPAEPEDVEAAVPLSKKESPRADTMESPEASAAESLENRWFGR